MLLLRFLLLKIGQNRWFTLGTLLGLTVATAFAMSIPMYADGTLKRVVAKSLQEETKGLPAASLYMKYQLSGASGAKLDGIMEADAWIRGELPGRIGFAVDAFSSRIALPASIVRSMEGGQGASSRLVRMELASQSGFSEGVDLEDGRLPREGIQDGVVEALALAETMGRYDWKTGDTFSYDAKNGEGKTKRIAVRIAGVYKLKDETELRWAIDGKDKLVTTLWVSDGTMKNDLLKEMELVPDSASWFYAFDLSDVRIRDLSPLIGELNRLELHLHGILANTKVNLSFIEMLRDFQRQSAMLITTLFALAAPVMAMVLYFITLNAQQALERQRSDIAVLHSRGASPRQIVMLYALEASLLGALALALGVGLAWFMAKTIGSSSGFLTFVGRKSLPIGLSGTSWTLGAIAVLLAVAATIAPIRKYAKASIVEHTQRKARRGGKPLWQRFYADVVLLGLSGAGWYLLDAGRLVSPSGGGDGGAEIEPALFVLPALMIFSAGLVYMRLFPILLRCWNALMKNRMPVMAYLTFTQLSRSAASFYPIMILLILTIGLGAYGSSAARTMDLNASDRTQYQYGSDVVLKLAWEGVLDENDENKIYYTEPSFETFHGLDGVSSATRVLKATGKIELGGKQAGNGRVIGIDNVDFSRTAWFREDMYEVHPYLYLDALGIAEQAVLVSEAFAAKYGVQAGDPVSLSIGYDAAPVDFVIVGIVPYWPSLYPDEAPFFIGNLDYIYQQVEKIPYEVWLDLEEGAKLAPALETLADRGIEVTQIDDARGELVDRRNHPAQGGVFGILSLGFMISLLVSLLGYLIFWLFSLSRRVVQFGIVRAMGLSRWQLLGMLLLEQLLTTGLSVVAGIALGQAAGRLFLPFLQEGGDAARRIPPFRIVFEAEDSLKLYVLTGIMLAAGAILLLLQLRSLRITQAIKLGEER